MGAMSDHNAMHTPIARGREDRRAQAPRQTAGTRHHTSVTLGGGARRAGAAIGAHVDVWQRMASRRRPFSAQEAHMQHPRFSFAPVRILARPALMILAAAALVFGPVGAPDARADGGDVARAAIGIAAAVIIGSVIADALDNDGNSHDRRASGYRPAAPPQWHVVRRAPWPGPQHDRGYRDHDRHDALHRRGHSHDDRRADRGGHDRHDARAPQVWHKGGAVAQRRDRDDIWRGGDRDPWIGDSRIRRGDQDSDRRYTSADMRGSDDGRRAAAYREMERRRLIYAPRANR
jgi:hypothetical protein